MIHGPEKFDLLTVNGEKVEFIVNWTAGLANCDFVKMRIDGKRDILLPRSALIRAAMFLGTEDEQDNLIPTRSQRIRQFRKNFTIKVLRDIKAGEELEFVGSFDVPMNADSMPVLSSTNTVG